jgi:hypothetical protein
MSRIQYKEIVLPNDVAPGDVLQIKYDADGIVYDLFDNSMENCKVEYGYDLYSDTAIPRFHNSLTIDDIDKLGKSGYESVLKAVQAIEMCPLGEVHSAIADIKKMVYEACPSLLPKDPRNR